MKKNTTKWNVTGDGLSILQLGSSPTKDGIVSFIPADGRDIHLTYYVKSGEMNFHVTDRDKTPNKVWEIPSVSVDEMAMKVARRYKRLIVKYHPNQKMYVLGPESRSMLCSSISAFSANPKGQSHDIDFLKMAEVILREHAGKKDLDKVRIKDALRLGISFGFSFSKTQSYIVIPLREGYCLRVNTNLRSGIFGVMPMWKAIDAWMQYLDSEEVLDMIIGPVKESLMERVKVLKDVASHSGE